MLSNLLCCACSCVGLQVCEKALADYMESKRRAFPRFYFVSTADLLDILSNGNNPVKVRLHVSFPGCSFCRSTCA
jgi:dissimilatory sulfite reductase (desulfoviridin) alpha/beta subunit